MSDRRAQMSSAYPGDTREHRHRNDQRHRTMAKSWSLQPAGPRAPGPARANHESRPTHQAKKRVTKTTAKAPTNTNGPSDATASATTLRRRMLSRMHAVQELGQQVEGANIASERHQALEALRVIAADDQHTRQCGKTCRGTTSTAMIAFARRSGPLRVPQRERNTSEVRSRRAYHNPPLSHQRCSQHRAPAIVPATDPRGPQFRRQRGDRRLVASTIASGLRIVPSNK